MSPHTTNTTHEKASTDTLPSGHAGRRRLIIALTVLAFLAIAAAALYAISLIVEAVILLMLSALLAYLNYPLVQVLQRHLPPPLAIAVAYLLVAGALAVVMYIVTSSLIRQSSALAQYIQFLLSPAGERQLQSISDSLGKFGISKAQIIQFENQLLAQVQSALSGLLPFLIVFFSNLINLVLLVTLSVYFVIDGPRIVRWLRLKTPVSQRDTINFLVSALDQSLGGYFRGSLLQALHRRPGYQRWARAAARPICSFAGNALLFPFLCPGDRFHCDISVVYPGGPATGVGGDAHCGCVYDDSPGDCPGADTRATHFQQSSGSSSHCGPVRALRWRRTLRIAGRVPCYPCCWRAPADHRGSLAQVER